MRSLAILAIVTGLTTVAFHKVFVALTPRFLLSARILAIRSQIGAAWSRNRADTILTVMARFAAVTLHEFPRAFTPTSLLGASVL